MSDAVPPSPRGQWQFSLRTMFIALTLVALMLAPIAYFGWLGVLPLVLMGACAAGAYCLSRAPSMVLTLGVGAILLMLLLALLYPGVSTPPSFHQRMACVNNLKQLALAMHLYHNDHGHFPPAYVADASGQPLLSWRVLLLPYLEEKEKFAAIKLDEPWNSPNNARVADCPRIFQCPNDIGAKQNSQMTSYAVVTGPGTAFPGEGTTTINKMLDGTSATILIVEVANSGIHWMEPRDLNIQQMAPTINAISGQGISSKHVAGVNVAFADGHVGYLRNDLPAEELRARLTINGLEIIAEDP
jgi:prepilin-type processing-associated H-X9-DG protein